MKALNIIITLAVFGILGFCGLILYSQYRYYVFASRTDFGGYGPTITNEFYIIFISTLVLALLSVPTIIYQIKQIVNKPEPMQNTDLIDDDIIGKPIQTTTHRYLFSSTRLYAFALFTQLILVGNKLINTFQRIDDTKQVIISFLVFMAALVGVYFLFINKKSS